MSTMKRLRVIGAIAFAAVSAAFAASPAGAYQYWSSGVTGYSETFAGTCRYLDAWRVLQLSTSPPRIYGRDLQYGAGNDAQWVRFRLYLINANGAAIRENAWSDWAVAYDNRPATYFTDSRLGFTSVPAGSMIDIRVEWWQTGMLGAAAHRVQPYSYYSGMQGPFGPMSGCGGTVY
jgi:hypothetical protein